MEQRTVTKKDIEKIKKTKGGGSLYFKKSRNCFIYEFYLGRSPSGKKKIVSAAASSEIEAVQKVWDKLKTLNIDFIMSEPTVEGYSREMSFGEFGLTYLMTERKPTIKSRTLNFYLDKFKIARALHNLRLCDLTSFKAQRCLNCMIEPDENGHSYSQRMIDAVYALLSSMAKFTKKKNLTAENWMEDVNKPKSRGCFVETNNTALPTSTVQQMVFAVCKDPVIAPIVILMINTGLRIGEVFGLQERDIIRSENVIQIRRAMSRDFVHDINTGKVLKERTILAEPKTKCSIRDVTVPDIVFEALDIWYDYRQKFKRIRSHVEAEGNKALVFPSTKGNIIDYGGFHRRFNKVLMDNFLGDDEIHFHRCRHTFTTMLLDNNTDIKVVSTALGHKDIQTTLNVYRSVTTKNKKEASEKMGTLFVDTVGGDMSKVTHLMKRGAATSDLRTVNNESP